MTENLAGAAGPGAGVGPVHSPGLQAETAPLGYKVSLENFYGPLDLLLHLVREQEVAIEAVSIARVAEQYCAYLDMMKTLDINLAGEFLVLAATLMVIKARALVPREAVAEEAEEDPSLDLIRKLIEYKRFKERARLLGGLAEARARRFARGVPQAPERAPAEAEAPGAEAPGAEAEPAKDLELWPLVSAFAALTRQIRLDVPMSILYADVPIERFMEMVLERLRRGGVVRFADLAGTSDKMKVIGTFLALLYLAKDQRVSMEQGEQGGEIRVALTEGTADAAGGGSVAEGVDAAQPVEGPPPSPGTNDAGAAGPDPISSA